MSYPNTVYTLPGANNSYSMREPMTLDGSSGGWRSKIRFKTDYSNLGLFCSTIAGKAYPITTSFGTMLRILMLQHPLYSNLYATSLSAKAVGTPSKTDTTISGLWSHAWVDVTFENPKYNTTGDQAYMTWEVDQGSTYTTVPGRKFRFSGGEPIDQDAGAFNVLNNYVLTLFQCPTQNDATIDSLSGCVNNATWMSRPAGTLLFGGCRSRLSVTMAGVVQYEKSLSFTYRSLPWNQSYQRNGVAASPLDPAGNPPYPSGDFNLLLEN